MLGKAYANQNCSAARALEIVGERWSLLILRDALFRGRSTYGEFQKSLGIATNILAARLEDFVANGLFVFQVKEGSSDSGFYRPTEKAMGLKPIIVALTEWGETWVPERKGPIEFTHGTCDGRISLTTVCSHCDENPSNSDIITRSKRSGHP